MQWYYSEGGMQRGPVSQEELLAMVANGQLGRHELVWREGMAQWQSFAEVDDLRPPSLSGAPPLPVAPPIPASTYPPFPQSAAGGAGGAYVPSGGLTQVSSYLWQSIVLTLLCCMPFGIVAIVYASKVDSLVAQGDLNRAFAASKSAKTWCWVALGTGLLINLAGAAFFFLSAATTAAAAAGHTP